MKTSDQGLIFDIKRFAVHDGYGLRTTIFFKGCPLRCKWCQNPEGLSIKRRPIYFENSCIHCQRCIEHALLDQIEYVNNRPYFNYGYLGNFDNLIKVCPSGAIRYDSKYYTVEQLVSVVKQDEVFYRNNGGVTISGGEPFMQGEFLIKLLKKLKQEKIHTAIETSLYTSKQLIQKVLPYVDLIYIDLKIFDENNHYKYTNVSSSLIKDNIVNVLTSEHKDKVIIRTPLIPTITATDDNVIAISSFLVKIYPQVKYELLNYNPLAPAKYSLVDLKYGLEESYKAFTKEEMLHFYKIVNLSGLKNLIIE